MRETYLPVDLQIVITNWKCGEPLDLLGKHVTDYRLKCQGFL